jgi:uncharacterized protein YndB with AHSA1/START domain
MAKEQMTTQPALQLKRTFQAPRDRVFRAWTDPKELALWFRASPDYSTRVPVLDFRVGGKYCLELRHKDGNVHRLAGTYREIKPPEKIVFTWRWEQDPNAYDSLVTVEFRDLGQSTEIALHHEQFPNVEECEKHNQGWNGCFDQFVKYL